MWPPPLTAYTCKKCGLKKKAWKESRCYKEKLCPTCLDSEGLGMYGEKGRK